MAGAVQNRAGARPEWQAGFHQVVEYSAVRGRFGNRDNNHQGKETKLGRKVSDRDQEGVKPLKLSRTTEVRAGSVSAVQRTRSTKHGNLHGG
jgi:hypothetical protein